MFTGMIKTLAMLNSGTGEPAWNMAFDEALLICAAESEQPVLRFYSWSPPAASFGYSQRYREVERQTRLRPLVRRPTGGGIVPHDRDWTYSLTIPPSHSWYQLRAIESYRQIHAWIVTAFSAIHFVTELAPTPHKQLPGQCFVGHEQYDVLWQGRKIAGAAQRRNRQGLLIQGSVQPPPGAIRAEWEDAMRRSMPADFFDAAVPISSMTKVASLAEALVESKYGRSDYNTGR